jgi:hypothetical protein
LFQDSRYSKITESLHSTREIPEQALGWKSRCPAIGEAVFRPWSCSGLVSAMCSGMYCRRDSRYSTMTESLPSAHETFLSKHSGGIRAAEELLFCCGCSCVMIVLPMGLKLGFHSTRNYASHTCDTQQHCAFPCYMLTHLQCRGYDLMQRPCGFRIGLDGRIDRLAAHTKNIVA